MEQQNNLKTYRPDGKVLYDLLEIAKKHKLDIYEFEAELKIALKLIEKSNNCIFKDMKDICEWMQHTINARIKVKKEG